MNPWLIAAGLLLLALLPCGWIVIRGPTMDRLVALEFASATTATLLVVLAEGLPQPTVLDVAFLLAVLALPSGLVFAYFLERWP
jgi:multisubunit Na+/H+ antiporter MnhF subunit